MSKAIVYCIVLLMVVVSCECKNMHFRKLPEDEILFTGVAQSSPKTFYRKDQSIALRLHLSSDNKEIQFVVKDWKETSGKKGTLSTSPVGLGENTLHYTPEEPGTHKLEISVLPDGEEGDAKIFHYTVDVPISDWQATGKADATGNLLLTIKGDPNEWSDATWHIQSTRWSRGLEGSIDNSHTQVKYGDNTLPITLQRVALQELPKLYIDLKGPDETIKPCQIDLGMLCVATLNQDCHQGAAGESSSAHSDTVHQQVSQYTGELGGVEREEAKQALTARLEETKRHQQATKDRLEHLEKNLNIFSTQHGSDTTELERSRGTLQRDLTALDASIGILQPMVEQLEARSHGAIEPWGVLYERLKTGQYEEDRMASQLASPLLDVRKEGDQGETLLHLAIRQRNIALSRRLINLGAVVNSRDMLGNTPLDHASSTHDRAAIAMLMSKGAVPDPPADWQLQGDYDHQNQQLILNISDVSIPLQKEQWQIKSTTWSEGLSRQINDNAVLIPGVNKVPLEVVMTTLKEEPNLEVWIQGPDRVIQSITLNLRAACVFKLKEQEQVLAEKTERIATYCREVQEKNAASAPQINKEATDAMNTLLGQLTAFQRQYQEDLDTFSCNLEELEITNENLALFNSNHDRLQEAIHSIVEAQRELQCQKSEIFGAEKWLQYFGEVGPEPPIPAHIEALLNQPCKLFPGKKVYQTHLLTLIPATVDGIPLTLNSFETLLAKSKEAGNNARGYKRYNKDLQSTFGEQTCETSYWVLMTRDVLLGSLDKPYEAQCSLVADKAQATSIPYTLPSLLEGVVSTLCYYVETGNRLFSYHPRTTLSRSSNKFRRGKYLLCMCFGKFDIHGIELCNFHAFEWGHVGVAAVVH